MQFQSKFFYFCFCAQNIFSENLVAQPCCKSSILFFVCPQVIKIIHHMLCPDFFWRSKRNKLKEKSHLAVIITNRCRSIIQRRSRLDQLLQCFYRSITEYYTFFSSCYCLCLMVRRILWKNIRFFLPSEGGTVQHETDCKT